MLRGSVGVPVKAYAANTMLSIIVFPDNFASSTLSIMGSLTTDFIPLLTLVFGVLLSVLVVSFLVRILTHH